MEFSKGKLPVLCFIGKHSVTVVFIDLNMFHRSNGFELQGKIQCEDLP
jgi:hypothetical protein